MLTCTPAGASFEWRFSELFSDAEASMQFIELVSQGANEGQASGAQIHSTFTGQTITLNQDLTGSTLGKRLLLATSGFGSLPGAVEPDFPTIPLPDFFFNPYGDTLTLTHGGTIDSRTFASIPIDGVNSRKYPANTDSINSPTNFSDQWGSINLNPNFGDYNNNGVVDAADYVVFRKYLNTTEVIPNDETPEWVVEEDWGVWRRRFGSTGPGGGASTSTVPEPAGPIFSMLLSALLFFRRKRARPHFSYVAAP
jgi:hypothetical protein